MSESIQCWQCGTRMTLDELASNDGDCPRCEVEVHLAEYLGNALSRVSALEAELAKLRAGQEPVAWRMWNGKTWRFCYSDAHGKRGWEALYTAPQPSAVPDGFVLVPVEPTPEMVSAAEEAHMPFGDMDIALRMAILSAPSVPATVQGVNAQLLEALEFAAKSLATMTSADGSGHADIALCVLRMAGYDADERERMVEAWKQNTQWRIDAAIAAARKGEGE